MDRTLNRVHATLFATGVVLIVVAVGLSYLIINDHSYNRAMLRADYLTAAGHRSDFGRYATARQHQLAGAYEDAHSAFAIIDLEKSTSLSVPVLFYLAENYVQQAVVFEQKGDDEQRIPLLELAKENYRQVLAEEPDNWPARTNLAHVLRMLPDARLYESDDEDIMPERSPQAEVQTMGYDRLP